MEFFHFFCHCYSNFFHKGSIPGLSQCSSNRKCRTELIISVCVFVSLICSQVSIFQRSKDTDSIYCVCFSVYFIILLKSQSCRPIGHDQWGNTILLIKSSRGLTGRTRNTDSCRPQITGDSSNIPIKQREQILCRNLIFRLAGAFCSLLWFRIIDISSNLLILCLLFPFQSSGRKILAVINFFSNISLILKDIRFIQDHTLRHFKHCNQRKRCNAVSDPDSIITFFSNPGMLLFGKICQCLSVDPDFQQFFFPRLQKFCFCKASQPTVFLP